MARGGVAGRPALRKGRRPGFPIVKPASKMSGYNGDPFALIAATGYPPEVGVTSQDKEDEVPQKYAISIAQRPVGDETIVDGGAPIPGWEHLYTVPNHNSIPNHKLLAAGIAQGQQVETQRGVTTQHRIAPAKCCPDCSGCSCHLERNSGYGKSFVIPPTEHKPRGRKRSRPSAGLATRKQRGDKNDDEREYTIKTEQTYSLYIGNFDELSMFYEVRLKELTMKPLRPIVTEWVKQMESRRMKDYGPYHKRLPSDMPLHRTPPWWPKNITYTEPSHLQSHSLIPLAISILSLHRRIDEPKRQGNWIAGLEKSAMYSVSMTPIDQFTAGKDPQYSKLMKERALDRILPSIFDVARSHEDHLAQYNLYEGTGHRDPGLGKQHAWQRIPRPDRNPSMSRRKRICQSKPEASSRDEAVEDDSGDETEPDEQMDIASSCFTSFQSSAARQEEKDTTALPLAGIPTASQSSSTKPVEIGCISPGFDSRPPDTALQGPMKTFNSVFYQSMGRLDTRQSDNMDAKGGSDFETLQDPRNFQIGQNPYDEIADRAAAQFPGSEISPISSASLYNNRNMNPSFTTSFTPYPPQFKDSTFGPMMGTNLSGCTPTFDQSSLNAVTLDTPIESSHVKPSYHGLPNFSNC